MKLNYFFLKFIRGDQVNEILAQWWAFLAASALIIWAIRNSNIGEYDYVDVDYEIKEKRVGGTYCENPYYERASKDV